MESTNAMVNYRNKDQNINEYIMTNSRRIDKSRYLNQSELSRIVAISEPSVHRSVRTISTFTANGGCT